MSRPLAAWTPRRTLFVGPAALLIATLHAVDPGKPSVSALEVTAYRAIGAKHPDPAIRNGDTLAERFLGAEERDILRKAKSDLVLNALALDTERAWASLGIRRGFAQAVHVRTRHIDAMFEESLALGATQVVILGAGLDSRPYRYGTRLAAARVFEVDFPPTQEYKKKRVREVVGSLPSHVRYVPIDFTKDDLRTVLEAAGYDRGRKTIFIWEGVTFYIPEAAVDATLRFVAQHSAPGSRIVFDYFLASTLTSPHATLKDVMSRLEAVKEPIIFGLPDEDRQGFVTKRGLAIVSDVHMSELRARYLPPAEAGALPELAKAGSYICTAAVR
ncbi:MAG TPA: SAM-dependent methyltransferase [Vicinamibacterales bacterium]|nr:SAM-dependent methyltransferase [Vicinamibacterales bacterium]